MPITTSGQRDPTESREIFLPLAAPARLLCRVLDHALRQAHATRGLIFDRQQVIRAVGYKQPEKIVAWRSLEGLLTECGGVTLCRSPFFGGELRETSTAFALSTGAAGVLVGPPGNLAGGAIQKEAPLSPDRIAAFGEWLQLASKPAAVSLSNERLHRMLRRQPL